MKAFRFSGRLVGIVLAASFATACATPPENPEALAEYEEINDPLEPMNREFFSWNRSLDTAIFKPLAEAYLSLPEQARDGIHNMISNVRSPVNLANDVMQGDFDRAETTAKRFVVNSTFGVAGIFDVASDMGIGTSRSEDFGQTLGTWGSPTGPYIVVPILGPSSPRALAGKVADSFIDPWGYIFDSQGMELEYMLIRGGIEGIDERSNVITVLDDIEKSSLDFYATIRSLYRQRREASVNNGEVDPDVPSGSFMTYTDSIQSAEGGFLVQ